MLRTRQLEAKIAELEEGNVVAFFVEPAQGVGPMIISPSTYWPEIQRICDAHDILAIANKVICGFGRTGNWFESETLGIQPDIMTIANGLSSGEGTEVIARTGLNHGYSYAGHPNVG